MINLLIIDDNKQDSDLVLHTISQQFKDVDTDVATDIKTGLELLSHKKYNIVLVDLVLPDGEGIAVVKYIKQKSLSVASTIMFSEESDPDKMIKCLHAGASDYILKDSEFSQKVAEVVGIAIKLSNAGLPLKMLEERLTDQFKKLILYGYEMGKKNGEKAKTLKGE